MKADHADLRPARLPYEPPSVVVLGTVQELTRTGITGQSDGPAGFDELGS